MSATILREELAGIDPHYESLLAQEKILEAAIMICPDGPAAEPLRCILDSVRGQLDELSDRRARLRNDLLEIGKSWELRDAANGYNLSEM